MWWLCCTGISLIWQIMVNKIIKGTDQWSWISGFLIGFISIETLSHSISLVSPVEYKQICIAKWTTLSGHQANHSDFHKLLICHAKTSNRQKDLNLHRLQRKVQLHTKMFSLNINRQALDYLSRQIKTSRQKKLYRVHSYSNLTLRHNLVLEVKR